MQKLSVPDRLRYAFYLQPRYGMQELYATIYAGLIKKRSGKTTASDDQVLATFPNSTKVLADQMAEDDKKASPN